MGINLSSGIKIINIIFIKRIKLLKKSIASESLKKNRNNLRNKKIKNSQILLIIIITLKNGPFQPPISIKKMIKMIHRS